jgi:Domain of unknown function (DUF4397)
MLLRLKNSLCLSLSIVISLLLTSCGGGDSQTRVRLVNAIVDSPVIDMFLDNRVIGSLSFRQTSADYALTEGNIALKLALPNAPTSSTALFTNTTNYEKNKRYTQVVIGKQVAGATTGINLLTLIDANNSAASSAFKVRFAHAAPDLGALDVYLTQDGKDFALDTPKLTAIAFKSVSPVNGASAIELLNGKYRLRLTLNATKTVVFDSGSFSETSGSDIQFVIAASDNVTGASAATVLYIPSVGSAKELIDTRTGFRFANFGTATPFNGQYDVYLRDVTDTTTLGLKLFANTSVNQVSARVDVSAGNKRLSLTQPGSTAEVLGFDVALVAGKRQTAYLIGNAASTGTPQALKLTLATDESASTLIGQAKVRFFVFDAANTTNRDLVTSSNGLLGSRLVTGVGYLGSSTASVNPISTYQSVPSGTYQLATIGTTLASPLIPTTTGTTAMFSAQRSYSVIQTAAPTALAILSDD